MRSAFVYDGPARRAILRLKFSGWRDIAPAFADAIASAGHVPDVDGGKNKKIYIKSITLCYPV